MAKTHGNGRHRYLVARDVLDADVVINLPKLKTHKKAGITCALKNLIGINGNKEYLPHHRIGGADLGGDCYPGKSRVKSMLEYAADQQNLTDPERRDEFGAGVATQLNRVLAPDGRQSRHRRFVERQRHDLAHGPRSQPRSCFTARLMARWLRSARRRVVHLADAIVAGQGDGPLSPQPLSLGCCSRETMRRVSIGLARDCLVTTRNFCRSCARRLESFVGPSRRPERKRSLVRGDWGTGKIDRVMIRRSAAGGPSIWLARRGGSQARCIKI